MTDKIVTLNNPTERARRALIASHAEILPPQTRHEWRVKPLKQWLEAAPEGAIIALPSWGGVALYERNGRVEADEYRLPRLLDLGFGRHWLVIRTPATTDSAADLLCSVGAYCIRRYHLMYCNGCTHSTHHGTHLYEVWAVPPEAVRPDGMIADKHSTMLAIRSSGAGYQEWTTVMVDGEPDMPDEQRFPYPPRIHDIADVVVGDKSVFQAAVNAGLAWSAAIRHDDWYSGNGWDCQRHVICTFDNIPPLGVAAEFNAVTLFDPAAERHPRQYIVQES